MTPGFRIIAAGTDITPIISGRLISLIISDETGLKSDRVEITPDDRDNLIELPAPGALLIIYGLQGNLSGSDGPLYRR